MSHKLGLCFIPDSYESNVCAQKKTKQQTQKFSKFQVAYFFTNKQHLFNLERQKLTS